MFSGISVTMSVAMNLGATAFKVIPQAGTSLANDLTQDVDIFAAINKLGELKARGLLTEEEFIHKKADLLGRL
jgi:hypothetical protein